ncbi:MAG: 2-amino-4-hydroxy-6-hydroxymethyldihydropteridine diphosphokinase [Candidatus Omnitrophica bacterium]|nr:2-amino-4-hydroxy-6-hydroxymethyldihydropteridine diphosphokinase [Candidatus Omnitrophota bacterium]
MSITYLALGSNIADRQNNIKRAVDQLNRRGIHIEKISSIIETDPIGPPQEKFLNAAAKATTTLSPEELLKTIKEIEKDLGRIKTIHHGPRTIDIDILLYDNIQLKSKNLTIPHPEMFKREFVMTPLKEIYPEIAQKTKGTIQ